MKKIIALLVFVALSSPAFAGKIEIKGSTTVLPLAQKTMEAYMALKWEEVYAYEHTPHPIEYAMYYSC